MWRIDDWTLADFLVEGDVIRFNDIILTITNIEEDDDDYLKIIGTDDMWEERIEVMIPSLDTVPLLVWE
jgi:hypothetical protein